MTLLLPADAVLFDNDGVLVDSTAAGDAAWTTWSLARGLDPAVVLSDMHGRRSWETAARHVAAQDVAAATEEIDELELATADQIVALPGSVPLLGSIPDGARAIVTSATRPLLLARLRAAGLPLPSAVVTSEDVTAGKPDPAPYLAGAALLGVPVERCIVVEDSPAGIAAGLAAGAAAVVGVGRGALGRGARAVVADLRDLRWTGAGLEVLRRLDDGGEG